MVSAAGCSSDGRGQRRRARGRAVGCPPHRGAPSRPSRNVRRPRSEQRAPGSRSRLSRSSPPWAAPFSSPAMRAPAASARRGRWRRCSRRSRWLMSCTTARIASAGGGWYVIALVVATGVTARARRPRVGRAAAQRRSAVAAVILVASFLVNGLDRADQWFERARGDPIAEYQIVAKEGPRAPRLVARRSRVVGRGALSAPRPDRG